MTESNSLRERARTILLEHGWNSTCLQILNPGIRLWLSQDGEAVVGWVRSGRLAIVAGSPICRQDRLPEVVQEWEQFAQSQGLESAYFGAEARLQEALADENEWVQVTLGSQPEWRPEAFLQEFDRHASLGFQLRRAQRKGVTVRRWSRAEGEHSPDLYRLLGEWLETRGLPTLHFLVEPETLGDLRDRRLYVAEMNGEPVGFVSLCPVPARSGWLTEQFVRGHKAPNGTVELMLYSAVQAAKSDGAAYLTMGIVPLLYPGGGDPPHDPGWLRLARSWARAHYTRFYNFRGLAEFKNKFGPEQWVPVVVIVKGRKFRLRHLRAIGQAFTIMPPEAALLVGFWRAAAEELRRLRAWRKPTP